jgi:hypothetical protein
MFGGNELLGKFSLKGLTLKKQPNKQAAELAEKRPMFVL